MMKTYKVSFQLFPLWMESQLHPVVSGSVMASGRLQFPRVFLSGSDFLSDHLNKCNI